MNPAHKLRILRKVQRQRFGNRWVTKETAFRQFLARLRKKTTSGRFSAQYTAFWQQAAGQMFELDAAEVEKRLAAAIPTIDRAADAMQGLGDACAKAGRVVKLALGGPLGAVVPPPNWPEYAKAAVEEKERLLRSLLLPPPPAYDGAPFSVIGPCDDERRKQFMAGPTPVGPFVDMPAPGVGRIDVDIVAPSGVYELKTQDHGKSDP